MTARQPPGEKGAKACTIGCDLSRDGYFCAYFSGETTKKESKSMKNGARYVVTTHWGTFSLDEASYQDYLAGRLWISWNPSKQEQSKLTSTGYIPPNVTDQAIALREKADKVGVLTTLHQLGISEPHPLPRIGNVERYLIRKRPYFIADFLIRSIIRTRCLRIPR